MCLLMYYNESFKLLNIGCLIVEIIFENYVFKWDRIEFDYVLLVLL